MAVSPGLEWPFRLLPPRQSWSRGPLAWSAALHALGFGLAGWVTRGGYQGPPSPPVVHTTRSYAMHYLLLTRPETRPEPRPERLPERRLGPVIPAKVPASQPSSTLDSGNRSNPARSRLQIEELPPGAVAGIGQVVTTPGSDCSAGGGLLGKLGLRVPDTGLGPARRGLDRVAELMSGAGSACPELPPPGAWARRDFVVAAAFVVDTNGMVDPATLQVIESPGRPRTDQRFHSRIYVVGARVRPDQRQLDPVVYDSVVSHEVASHVADLVFRPALEKGRTVRSTILISCQTSRPD